MKAKHLYLALCLAGTVIPYLEFAPWLAEHGLDLRLFIEELFSTRIGAFFGLDVMVAAVALLSFAWFERRRGLRRWWLVIPATLLVGVSLGLPLLLYLRED